jgi:hypothetical protein
MWYFAGWEPEYSHDHWGHLAERSPERVPLLRDPTVRFGDESYYWNGHRDVVAWHVRWMREAGVDSVIFEFIPTYRDGKLSTPLWGNRALELGFLGKETLGGPPVTRGLYEDDIDFTIMWTNHAVPGYGSDGADEELADYLMTQYLAQPNYSRIGGKAVLLLWMPSTLVDVLGSEEAAAKYVDILRDAARDAGVGELMILSVQQYDEVDLLARLGLDGSTGYHLDLTNGSTSTTRTLPDGEVITDTHEDFDTQTLPGYQRVWQETARACAERGMQYLVPTCPMQDWTPLHRDWKSVIYDNTSPAGFARMLDAARDTIAKESLEPVVLIEAWNEWGEGSYLEPSLEYGFAWLNALRDASTVPPGGLGR